jgi:tRNA(fMet)-specific endonuclease VapC
MAKRVYLLDTNILSDMVRNPAGRIRDRIAEVGEETVCTSIVLVSELRFGALKKGSSRLASQLEKVLSPLEILPFEQPADLRYAEIRVALERARTSIGGNDLLIAAQTLALELTLVTANVDEFHRVPGLTVEHWLTDAGTTPMPLS